MPSNPSSRRQGQLSGQTAFKALLVAGALLAGLAQARAEELTAAQVFTGNQAYSGVGVHFTVNSPITVTGLGLFDSGQDGFAAPDGSPLTAVLWSVTNFTAGTGVALASQTFSSSSSGTLNSLTGYSFKPITAIDLPAGDYVLAGYGWTGVDLEHNCNVDSSACDVFNTADGALSYIDSPFGGGADSPNVMPNTLGFGTAHFFGGPSMQFGVPEPASLALLTVSLAALGGLRRRRSAG